MPSSDPVPLVTPPLEAARRQGTPHPDRYSIREVGGERYLCCAEAPEVRVIVDRSAVVTESEARKAPPGTIFVDGAAQAPPFLDAERPVFNLDHHEGCIRAFTTAACEQALVLVLRGLDLGARPWAIRVGEPDLDAILAIWVLLNAVHLRDPESPCRQRLIPLIRLESVIDAHGAEMEGVSGLPKDRLRELSAALASLRRPEAELRRAGDWQGADLLEHTARVLREIDRIAFPPGSIEEPVEVEVLERASVGGESLALVCRSAAGIYEVEARLKRVYGKRLGILALEGAPGTFTLRQADPFLPTDLEAVYDELNGLDPAVAAHGRRNRWGGSGDIGGSPKETGTRLRPREIAEACAWAFRKPSAAGRLGAVICALGAAALALLGGYLASWSAADLSWLRLEDSLPVPSAAALVAVGMALLLALGGRRPRAFGLSPPAGVEWMYPLPVALAAATVGGVWMPEVGEGTARTSLLGVTVLLAVGAEMVFRGAVHGVLARRFRVSHAGGPWFLSTPTLVSAIVYSFSGALLPLTPGPFVTEPGAAGVLFPVAGMLLFGLGAGMARERSGSVLAPLLLHLFGIALLYGLAISA